jgi:hypothetical protein
MNEARKKPSEFVKWMGPLLDCLRALGGSAKPREVSAWIAESQKISAQKREETLKSGEERFHNQVAWARRHSSRCGCPPRSRRCSPRSMSGSRGFDTKTSRDDHSHGWIGSFDTLIEVLAGQPGRV